MMSLSIALALAVVLFMSAFLYSVVKVSEE